MSTFTKRPEVMKHIRDNEPWWFRLDEEIRKRTKSSSIFDFWDQFRDENDHLWVVCDHRVYDLLQQDPDMPVCVIVDRLTEENLIPGL